MEGVMPSYKEVYEDVQKKAKQSKSTCIFIKSSLWASTRQCLSFDHPDNFQPGTLTSFQ
jgi:hypothetical protein